MEDLPEDVINKRITWDLYEPLWIQYKLSYTIITRKKNKEKSNDLFF